MLWPIVLPAQITFALLLALIAFLTARAPAWKWRRRRTLMISSLLGVLLFVPSCLGIMGIVDRFRFGTFEFATASEVKDFRIERFLPPTATAITLRKDPTGHWARYSIPESDLQAFVEGLWKRSGEHSAIPREELPSPPRASPVASASDTRTLIRSEFQRKFEATGWETPSTLLEMHGPVEPDGGGVIYFYDPITQAAYHRGRYW
ncbi:hypothetical protein [Planctomicrobium sp. SH664]|uniref:hypothetical protein n=1 Tax=Planctomicrobium sp. SH664 TaxID=3448125 RepID=UPI003F5C8D7A